MKLPCIGFGDFSIRMDTRDAIDPSDRDAPSVGAHERYNQGFATSGVYRATFQARGRPSGQDRELVSPATPFTFHTLPLRSVDIWTATHWPCECGANAHRVVDLGQFERWTMRDNLPVSATDDGFYQLRMGVAE